MLRAAEQSRGVLIPVSHEPAIRQPLQPSLSAEPVGIAAQLAAIETAFLRSPYCGKAGVTVNSAVLPICLVPFAAVSNSST